MEQYFFQQGRMQIAKIVVIIYLLVRRFFKSDYYNVCFLGFVF